MKDWFWPMYAGFAIGVVAVLAWATLAVAFIDKPSHKEALRVLGSADDTTGVRVLSQFWAK